MSNQILFLGKYDESMRRLEEKVINFLNSNDQGKLQAGKEPDVIRKDIDNYDCSVWVILGKVKPTLLLKNLISEASIIILCFDISDKDSLGFLVEGWGPIYKKSISNSHNQKILLIGTNSQNKNFQEENDLDIRIDDIKNEFCCIKYIIESNLIDENKISDDLINYLQGILKTMPKKGKEEPKITMANQIKAKHSHTSSNYELVDSQSRDNDNDNKESRESKEEEENNDNDFNKNHKSKEEEEEEEENNDNDNINSEIVTKDIENEIKSYTNETPIQFKDGKSTSYDLYENSKKAIITKSPQAKGDVFIPTTVNYKSIEYEIIKIGDEAFAGSSIESLSFATDSAILTIGNSAFKKSTLKKLCIPKNLKKLDDFWLKGAKELDEFEVDQENNFFLFEEGFLIYKNEQFQKILFAPRNIEGDFVIPKEITHIGQYSFYRRNDLTSVKSISSKLIKITDNSFYKCEKLKTISIKQKTKLILGNSCFSQLQSLESVEIACKELKICDGCFCNCTISSILIRCPGRILLSPKSFEKCIRLENISFRESSCIAIENECFSGASNLKSIDFSKVGKISFYLQSFKNCTDLQNISFVESSDVCIQKDCFGDTKIKSITFLNADKINLCLKAFMNCKTLESVTVKDAKELTIGRECFKDSLQLRSIMFITESISLGENFVNGCNSLTFISIQTKIGEINIFSKTFQNAKLKSVILNGPKIKLCSGCFKGIQTLESLEITGNDIEIGDQFIHNCQKLSSFTLRSEKSIKIGLNMFLGCNSLKNINIETHSNLNINKEEKNLGIINFENISICGKAITIDDSCFDNCLSLSSFTIKKSGPVQIGSSQFTNCKMLKTISIDSTDEIEKGKISNVKLGNFCFTGANDLDSFTIKTGALNINNDYFNPSSLTMLNLEVGIISIDQNRFSGFKSLRKLIIKSKSTIALGMGCFSKSVNLFSVNLTGKEIKIENSCFNECSSLTEFNINDAINVSFGKGIFIKCKKLWTIDIGVANNLSVAEGCFNGSCIDDVTFHGQNIIIGKECFKKCTTIKKFTILSAVTATLEISAFDGCTNLEFVKFNNISSKLKICENCFYKDKNIKVIEFQSKEVITDKNAFYKCSSIQFLKIEESDKIIFGDGSFQDCTGLLEININANTEFQALPNCFESANKIKTVQIKSAKVTISKYCFYKASLMSIFLILKSDETVLGENAFEYCNSLESVYVKSNKFKASSFCFVNASKLKNVDIIGSDILIGGHCFDGCSSLLNVNCLSADIIKLYETSFNGSSYTKYLNHKEGAKIMRINNKSNKKENDSLFSFHLW